MVILNPDGPRKRQVCFPSNLPPSQDKHCLSLLSMSLALWWAYIDSGDCAPSFYPDGNALWSLRERETEVSVSNASFCAFLVWHRVCHHLKAIVTCTQVWVHTCTLYSATALTFSKLLPSPARLLWVSWLILHAAGGTGTIPAPSWPLLLGFVYTPNYLFLATDCVPSDPGFHTETWGVVFQKALRWRRSWLGALFLARVATALQLSTFRWPSFHFII